MVKVFLNTTSPVELFTEDYEEVLNYVQEATNLTPECFYLEQNGKRVQDILSNSSLHVRLRLLGGKGGFGSMLRAIGAQIEKTTNREACRDLSGRRLRDINEEKRLKAWLDKQADREREAEERKKRKIEKLLAVPKHEFKDEGYEEARSKLTEKVCDAVEEGFKKSAEEQKGLKRKQEPSTSQQAANSKKKKAALWIDDDLSDDSDDSDDNDCEVNKNKGSSRALTSCKVDNANLLHNSSIVPENLPTPSESVSAVSK